MFKKFVIFKKIRFIRGMWNDCENKLYYNNKWVIYVVRYDSKCKYERRY